MDLNATLVIQLIVFFCLFGFISRYIWPPIIRTLDQRARRIAMGIAAADKAHSEMEKCNATIRKELNEAKMEAKRIILNSEERAIKIIDAANKRSIDISKSIEQDAHNKAKQLDIGIRHSIAKDIAKISMAYAEKIIRREISPEKNIDLLEEIKREWEKSI